MKRLELIICMVLLATLFAYAEKVATFSEIVNPYSFVIDSDTIYISQGITVFIYSIKDYRFIKKFGKEGEGPGEILLRRGSGNTEITLFITDKYLVVSSVGKILYFSKAGEFVKEIRTEKAGRWLNPFGDLFVGKTYVRGKKGDDKLYHGVVIYNNKLEKIKEIYRHLHGWQGVRNPFNPLTVEQAHFEVADNKVFVIDGAATKIMVFTSQGKQLFTITNPDKPLKFTEKDKQEKIAAYQHDTFWKRYYQNRRHMFKFPKYFPAILWFDLDTVDKKLFLGTQEKRGKNRKYFIFDFNGKLLKEIYIPFGGNIRFHNGKIYHLRENDNEEWDLYITLIK